MFPFTTLPAHLQQMVYEKLDVIDRANLKIALPKINQLKSLENEKKLIKPSQ